MVDKVQDLGLTRLPGAAHVEFHENIYITVEKTQTILGLGPLFPIYTQARLDEKEALMVIRKSEFTVLIYDQSRVRFSIFRGLSDNVKSHRNHFEPSHREAANTLWPLFLHYGNLAGKKLDVQTAHVESMVADLQRPPYREAVLELGLMDWVLKLEAVNIKFRELMTNRYNESVEKSVNTMHTVRTKTDKAYKAIVKHIENLIFVGFDDPGFKEFLIELNAIIKRYKNIMAQEFGRKNKGEGTEEDNSTIIEVEKLDENKYKIKEVKS